MKIPGDGSRKIRMDIAHNLEKRSENSRKYKTIAAVFELFLDMQEKIR